MQLSEKQLRNLSKYYGYLYGRTMGKQAYKFADKITHLVFGDYSKVTEEDLKNSETFEEKYRGKL